MKKGEKMTSESRIKMSKARIGFFHKEETKTKISVALRKYKKTEAHKQKLREYRLGRKASVETRKKMSLQRMDNKYSLGKNKGPDSHFWRGGVTNINKLIRNSPEYKEWRRQVFLRDDYTCQACGARGCELHADHELPFAYFPDLRFEVLNGRTLCVECHRKTPTHGEKGKKLAIELGWQQKLTN